MPMKALMIEATTCNGCRTPIMKCVSECCGETCFKNWADEMMTKNQRERLERWARENKTTVSEIKHQLKTAPPEIVMLRILLENGKVNIKTQNGSGRING